MRPGASSARPISDGDHSQNLWKSIVRDVPKCSWRCQCEGSLLQLIVSPCIGSASPLRAGCWAEEMLVRTDMASRGFGVGHEGLDRINTCSRVARLARSSGTSSRSRRLLLLDALRLGAGAVALCSLHYTGAGNVEGGGSMASEADTTDQGISML
jgi:hypothetical protein